jgi:phage host-nuclease inhibitor protein Gam
MATNRSKKTILQGVTREQADSAFAEYATADARTQQITSKMDMQITKIRESYQDELTKLQDKKSNTFDVLQVYATENKEVLFPKKKSVETTHGIFGFRTGTPKLKTQKGFTWSAVTNMLREFLPEYVRTTEEPSKDKLLADREVPEVAALFDKVGILVDQDETFFVEVKKEEVSIN